MDYYVDQKASNNCYEGGCQGGQITSKDLLFDIGEVEIN
jgi:hypothetical protein